MGLTTRIELLFERVFEFPFLGSRNLNLEELGRNLICVMHRQRRRLIFKHKVFVPNKYLIGVSALDYHDNLILLGELQRQLLELLRDYIKSRHYHLIDEELSVSFTVDPTVKRSRVRITAVMDKAGSGHGLEAPATVMDKAGSGHGRDARATIMDKVGAGHGRDARATFPMEVSSRQALSKTAESARENCIVATQRQVSSHKALLQILAAKEAAEAGAARSAMELIVDTRKLEPQNPLLPLLQTIAAIACGESSSALQEISQLKPNHDPLWFFILGMMEMERGNQSRAAELIKAGSAVAQDEPAGWLIEALWLIENNQPDAASPLLERIVAAGIDLKQVSAIFTPLHSANSNQQATAESPLKPRLELMITPNRTAQHIVFLPYSTLLIGQAPVCDIQLQEPGIATLHARLELEANTVTASPVTPSAMVFLEDILLAGKETLGNRTFMKIGRTTLLKLVPLMDGEVLRTLMVSHRDTIWFGGAGPIIIGRQTIAPPAADLPLADRRVSAAHCRIEFRGGSFVLFDNRSRNGTAVNQETVPEKVLAENDIITIGHTNLIVTGVNHAAG